MKESWIEKYKYFEEKWRKISKSSRAWDEDLDLGKYECVGITFQPDVSSPIRVGNRCSHSSITTQTINGGGQNPVFNETLRINVPMIEYSLKWEIYMLSRVRNYLEHQLHGFALIPLSEIIIKNEKLENDFTLSSTDLFHSPSGFVHLLLSYTGASSDVIDILPPLPVKGATADSELAKFDKIESPDPKIVKENHIMVSKYFGLSLERLVSSDTDDRFDAPV
ncbi:unnamed protein product [Lactuca saligna]|uniref:C2 domain-containing protein n=1 Tax=Lactuca saligna TaxID=75948 RepID=A0AA36E9B3_LACSI|nr:unnamed protein product [Lactuca saligna]